MRTSQICMDQGKSDRKKFMFISMIFFLNSTLITNTFGCAKFFILYSSSNSKSKFPKEGKTRIMMVFLHCCRVERNANAYSVIVFVLGGVKK